MFLLCFNHLPRIPIAISSVSLAYFISLSRTKVENHAMASLNQWPNIQESLDITHAKHGKVGSAAPGGSDDNLPQIEIRDGLPTKVLAMASVAAMPVSDTKNVLGSYIFLLARKTTGINEITIGKAAKLMLDLDNPLLMEIIESPKELKCRLAMAIT